LLEEVAQEIASFHIDMHCVTKDKVLEVETKLMTFQDEAKSFTIDCIGHAHIDMNWMWGFDETVSIVLDTFRTMLTLMDEYPEFTYSQSQAATYHIVEKYEPNMLQEIKRRVKEGRWEVTASAWTEFDKNMASGESHLRQYSTAREYICELFELDPKELIVGFEPDTFGHNARLPDILNLSGIQYYYHCRGNVDHTLYRWKGVEGREVVVFKEPSWYLGPSVTPLHDPSKGTLNTLEMDMAGEVARLYQSLGICRILQVYGVGDHGGGPTRIDIEGLKDIASWPLYPTILFSSFKNFFEHIEQYKERLPLVTGEINSIFTGCYTSQSEIKRGNHESEKMLIEAHLYSSVDVLSKGVPLSKEKSDSLLDGWKDLFFTQFHDILPGSCTSDSAIYALGLFQTIYAKANNVRTSAIRSIAHNIDTSSIHVPSISGKRSLGAGVGYRINSFDVSPIGGIEGTKRIVTLFNSTPSPRNEVAKVVLWDWEDTTREIGCLDARGNEVVVVAEKDQVIYWQHSAMVLYIPVTIPPFSHSSYIFYNTERALERIDGFKVNPRSETPRTYFLDNGVIRATFSPQTLELTSLINLKNDEELIESDSGLVLLDEDGLEGMSSWKVGREGTCIKDAFSVKDARIEKNPLYQKLTFKINVRSSTIFISYKIDAKSNILKVVSSIIWREWGDDSHTPQLSFALHLKGSRDHYLYDIPFTTIVREASSMHVPSLSWASGEVGNSVIQLIGRGKYGYCCNKETMRIMLLRSSTEPDLFPEVGKREIEFSIAVHSTEVSKKRLIQSSKAAITELQQVTHGQHKGSFAMDSSYIKVDGPFIITSVNIDEKKRIEIRGYETEGERGEVTLSLPCIDTSYKVKIVGTRVDEESITKNGSFSFSVIPNGLYTLKIRG